MLVSFLYSAPLLPNFNSFLLIQIIQIGFYKGFVQTWIACCGGNEKIKVKLESLLKILERDWGDATRDITTELQRIRAKFKQVHSFNKRDCAA